MKIAVILGTRPEIIKMSPIIRALGKKKIDSFILHTNQHFSSNMDRVFFNELELSQPKYNLNIQETLHGKMIGRMLEGIEKILMVEKPDWVLIQGDTNTVLAGALAASKLNIKIGHVEAGLRSYDRTMPEEINRVVADHLSDVLFCPTATQAKILKAEGIEGTRKVFITGNTVADAVYENIKIANRRAGLVHYSHNDYVVLTLHRPSNVDNREKLEKIIMDFTSALKKNGLFAYFPIHPRTKSNIERFGIKIDLDIIRMLEPVGYLEMLILEKNAKVILTDSGGLQEEACILGVPCITLRENTERPETINVGANVLLGSSTSQLEAIMIEALETKTTWENPYGDGNAGQTIIDKLLNE